MAIQAVVARRPCHCNSGDCRRSPARPTTALPLLGASCRALFLLYAVILPSACVEVIAASGLPTTPQGSAEVKPAQLPEALRAYEEAVMRPVALNGTGRWQTAAAAEENSTKRWQMMAAAGVANGTQRWLPIGGDANGTYPAEVEAMSPNINGSTQGLASTSTPAQIKLTTSTFCALVMFSLYGLFVWSVRTQNQELREFTSQLPRDTEMSEKKTGSSRSVSFPDLDRLLDNGFSSISRSGSMYAPPTLMLSTEPLTEEA